jgi:hypothetical protein
LTVPKNLQEIVDNAIKLPLPRGQVFILINDLTSKKIPLTASQNLIAKLFGQQPVET